MRDQADIAALVGSRICHDLISPIGAISNGVELMMMSAASASPELMLIAESVASANARIKFFRVAFGTVHSEQRISGREVEGILKELSSNSRLHYTWNTPNDLDRRDVRLAFLLIQCMETSLPYSGDIAVKCDEHGWQIHATSGRIRADAQLWAMLSAPPNAETELRITPSQAQFIFVPRELFARNLSLQQTHSDDSIIVSW